MEAEAAPVRLELGFVLRGIVGRRGRRETRERAQAYPTVAVWRAGLLAWRPLGADVHVQLRDRLSRCYHDL